MCVTNLTLDSNFIVFLLLFQFTLQHLFSDQGNDLLRMNGYHIVRRRIGQA